MSGLGLEGSDSVIGTPAPSHIHNSTKTRIHENISGARLPRTHDLQIPPCKIITQILQKYLKTAMITCCCVFVVVSRVYGGEAVGDGAEDAGLGTQAVQQLLVDIPENLGLDIDPLAGEVVFL